MVDAVAAAAPTADPARLVAVALEALASMFTGERRDFARWRQAVLDAEPALRERELLKLATLTDALVGCTERPRRRAGEGRRRRRGGNRGLPCRLRPLDRRR